MPAGNDFYHYQIASLRIPVQVLTVVYFVRYWVNMCVNVAKTVTITAIYVKPRGLFMLKGTGCLSEDLI